MTKKSQFNASASMLGYLYQVRYALYLALKKLPEVEDPDQHNVSIEKLDDIAFDNEGSATELLQTKFHGSPGNLTNRSADIWKTIRVWVDSIHTGKVELGKVILTMVTTQALPTDTIAGYLGIGQSRNTVEALKLMLEISAEDNDTNSKSYAAFLSLSDPQKDALVNSIYIVGNSDDLNQIRSKIVGYARQSVPSKSVEAFTNTLEGNWFNWSIQALSQSPTNVINLGRLLSLIDQLRPEYTDTNLPAEFTDDFPDAIDLDSDLRVFIQQLRLFDAPKTMLEQAIIYYYRAFEQRTKWSADGLLQPGELSRFDQKLHEEWKNHLAHLEIVEDIKTQEGKRRFAANLYRCCLDKGIVPIRRDFIESYVARGSFHILADQLKIGWHPEYLDQLSDASNEAAA